MDNLEIKWDSAWDKTDATTTEVAEYEGGQLYKMNPCHLLVPDERVLVREYARSIGFVYNFIANAEEL